MFYGLDWIATVPPTVKLAAQSFGKERAGLVFGWVFAAHQLGAAIAAYGAGLTRTLLLTYNPALFAAGAACLVAAVAVLAIRAAGRPAAPIRDAGRDLTACRRTFNAMSRRCPNLRTRSTAARVAGARSRARRATCA